MSADLARHAVESTSDTDNKLTWNHIKNNVGELMYELSSMKFEVPSQDNAGTESVRHTHTHLPLSSPTALCGS